MRLQHAFGMRLRRCIGRSKRYDGCLRVAGEATRRTACETPALLSMKKFSGQALSWDVSGGVTELALHREPCNEIGSLTLEELEKFVAALEDLRRESHTLIIYSTLSCGFCAGADLRELYRRSHEMERAVATKGVRDYLERIHRVMNTIDAAPLTTIAAVHGGVFGGRLIFIAGCLRSRHAKPGCGNLSRARMRSRICPNTYDKPQRGTENTEDLGSLSL